MWNVIVFPSAEAWEGKLALKRIKGVSELRLILIRSGDPFASMV